MTAIQIVGLCLVCLALGAIAGCEFKEWLDHKLDEARLDNMLSSLRRKGL